MTESGFGWPSRDTGTLIRQAIRTWRDSLINLTRSNRLLNFRLSRTSAIPLVRPSASEVLLRLSRGGSYRIRSLRPRPAEVGGEPDTEYSVDGRDVPLPPPAPGFLDTDKPWEDLIPALRALYRRSNQDYLDRGVWVLYLAFGSLIWIDEDKTQFTSPLLLVPVQIEDVGQDGAELKAAPEDPVINPALALKLSRQGIDLPGVDELEDVTLESVLGAVRVSVQARPGWQVTDTMVVSYFSFDKEAMYRDLLDNENQIADHPAVAALALGGKADVPSDFIFDEIADQDVDRLAAPESAPVILDADSSQRASIAAALQGQSFLMDGPPGTGKSQTIANMIGVLLHAGKTVLFVSEKAAALDVVRDRLDDVGLRPYLLELHSHKATRKEVAVALGTALDTVPVPPAAMLPMDMDTARKRREQLNAYAEAMNRVRNPLGYSLHHVLGMIAQLRDVPAAPSTGIAPVDLTVEAFVEIRATAARLSGVWRPARQGRTFIWRGVTEQGSLDARLYQAASALQSLRSVVTANAAFAEATELTRPSQAPALAWLLRHLALRPAGLPDEWLSADTLDAVTDGIARLSARLADISAGDNTGVQAAGAAWARVPASSALRPIDETDLIGLRPRAVNVDQLTEAQAVYLRDRFAADASMLEDRLGSLTGIADALGLHAPQNFREAENLLSIARLAAEHDRPQRQWLSGAGLDAARISARVLRDAWDAAANAQAQAAAYYTPDALHQDVGALADRMGEAGLISKLSADYRAGRKAVASFTKDGVDKDSALRNLQLAVAWKHAAESLRAAEAAHARILGPYYDGAATEWQRLDAVLSLADTAVRAAGGQDLSRASAFVADDVVADAALIEVTHAVTADLKAWSESVTAERPATLVPPELLNGTIADAVSWQRAHLQPLASAISFTREVSAAAGHSVSVGQARRLVELRDTADRAYASLAEDEVVFRDLFGDLYLGHLTDVAALRSALEWTRHLRTNVTSSDSALSPLQVKTAGSVIQTGHLDDAAEAWRSARDALLEAFSVDRQPELAAELDDYDDAADLIAALREDTGGQYEWHVYRSCRTALATRGLDVAVEFAIAEGVLPQQVPQVLERALLQEWADYHLAGDPDLSTIRAADRDSLVREYQDLDRALIASAAGSIMRACNARRPRADVGEAAIIHREAEKKRKHMPVRTLIERSHHVTQAIKPCFMMSPRAVSQYLSSNMRFDVVIFDEASQISPGDAINCIYRGAALILAGDQKQLPPSSFFGGATLDDDEEWSEDADDTADFESILDSAKASGAYRSLTLRWHYRSRHEALIAFSNASFYGGDLITFPSTHGEGPDVGVEFFFVEGTYRRGSTRDNPAEAEAVAQRVLHHFDTRPGLTLGVVTFSEAQAEAVDSAVRVARRSRPDLDRFFVNDRLRGFFVKSLESVQGDERDVLIFSIGYGPDENRKITMNFGPLNRQGGWRRLNVAVTRARYRNEIVSSIRAGDIPESVATEGVRHLRRYLDYAARGMVALALDTTAGGDAESPFEESVIGAIRSWGYEVTPQVGTTGYRIDIGVRHPDHPGVYALGVECDGYQYHSSRVARDRDRLREQVLRGLGWNLHRIWGTAWYRDRNGEEHKLRAAIEHALEAPVRGLISDTARRGNEQGRPVFETEAAYFDEDPSWAVPYQVADVPRLPSWTDPGEPGSHIEMVAGVRAVVTDEAPVHIAVLHQRLREAWNIGRIGARIRENIDIAILSAGILREGDFLNLANSAPVNVRTPTDQFQRKVEHVHDDELKLALVSIARDASGISHDELTAYVARLYGWNRRGPDIAARLGVLIERLRADGVLTARETAIADREGGATTQGWLTYSG